MTTPREFLLDALPEPKDFLTFEKFMEAALQHPDFGYYSSSIRDIGRGGDFSTSPTLHPVLGKAVAKWATDTQEELFLEEPLNLIEIGAGNARLAHAILAELPRARYHIVEASGRLRAQQAEVLGDRCHWHQSPADALDACGGSSLLFSNELVDAFPCRLFEWDGETWMEMGLEREGETLREARRRTAGGCVQSSAFAIGTPKAGQRVEVHETYRGWLHSWSAHWKEGALLTIDYGGMADEVYHRRPGGTIRGYLRQQRIEGAAIYHHMGGQDLTADVNFTDLQDWSHALGWENHRLETQREFVLRHLPDVEASIAVEPAVEFLLHPQGAGEAFKVLENRKA